MARHLVDHRLLLLVDPVRLVASELATNALVHARTAFTMTLTGADDVVVLSMRVGSLSLPAQRKPTGLEPVGRGLKIVELFSSDWGISSEDAMTTTWASFVTGTGAGRPTTRRTRSV